MKDELYAPRHVLWVSRVGWDCVAFFGVSSRKDTGDVWDTPRTGLIHAKCHYVFFTFVRKDVEVRCMEIVKIRP